MANLGIIFFLVLPGPKEIEAGTLWGTSLSRRAHIFQLDFSISFIIKILSFTVERPNIICGMSQYTKLVAGTMGAVDI